MTKVFDDHEILAVWERVLSLKKYGTTQALRVTAEQCKTSIERVISVVGLEE
jgi:hypothetical protein